jgi:Fe2+ transport system protein FeoA
MTLDAVPSGTTVRVSTRRLPAADQRRLTELGLRHGIHVEVVRQAPFGGPLALRVNGAGLLALRRSQAARIDVTDEATHA